MRVAAGGPFTGRVSGVPRVLLPVLAAVERDILFIVRVARILRAASKCKQDGHQATVCENSGQGQGLAMVAQSSSVSAATCPCANESSSGKTRPVILYVY